MVALMYAAGLPASKNSEKGNTFRVDTTKDAFASAMALLQSQGLPRVRYESLGDVFKKEGFVSSPLEERARLNHALSQEISHTISSIDGVVMARVHLAVPEREQLAEHTSPSSASVFVKHRPDVDLTGSVSKIKSMVVNGVENLPYENVTIALFPAKPFSVGVRPVTMPQKKGVQMAGLQSGSFVPTIIVGALLLLASLGFWLVKWFGKSTKMRAVLDQRSRAKLQ